MDIRKLFAKASGKPAEAGAAAAKPAPVEKDPSPSKKKATPSKGKAKAKGEMRVLFFVRLGDLRLRFGFRLFCHCFWGNSLLFTRSDSLFSAEEEDVIAIDDSDDDEVKVVTKTSKARPGPSASGARRPRAALLDSSSCFSHLHHACACSSGFQISLFVTAPSTPQSHN